MAAAPKSPGRASSARYQAEVAASRARFLSAEAIDPGTVRRPILASWRRSLGQNVAADKVQMSYDRDVRHDTRLGRTSAPVLRALSERLEGQPVSVVLTDQRGLVLERLTGDRDLERHLDRVLLAPGFSYAEEIVGTNGIGTALEMGGPAHVFGHEHYAEDLEELACAGVPIHDPVSGRLVGAIDLTCWRRDSGSLLLTVAKTTAEQIRDALMADSDASQMRVFQEYLRASRHGHGIVLAVHDDMLMINERGRSSLEPADQTAVLAQAAEARSSRRDRTVAVDLPSGQRARLDCRTVGGDDQVPGVVVHVKLDPHDLPAQEHRRSMAAPMALPGLVGSAAQWRHACRKVEEAFRAGEWLGVAGEDGVGKLALLQAVHLRRFPVGRYAVLDARTAPQGAEYLSEVRREFRQSVDTVILRHVDSLDTRTARGLCDVLRHARDIGGEYQPWVAVTLGQGTSSRGVLTLLELFPRTVEVPPLRLHMEDLPSLVSYFLARFGQGRHLECSPEAMRLLMRMTWPGNNEQVISVLREVVKNRRSGVIRPDDLPPEAHVVSRRVLSPMESIERDAIVRCLAAAQWNKTDAARALGMSRATIYRKIHDYGIVAPTPGPGVSD